MKTLRLLIIINKANQDIFKSVVDTFGLFASLMIVITSLGTLVVTYHTIKGSDTIVEWILRKSRQSTLGSRLIEIEVSKKIIRAKCKEFSIRATRSGEIPSVQTELDWLTEIAVIDPGWNHPVEINGISKQGAPSLQLNLLASGYEDFSKHLRAHALLSGNKVMQEQEKLSSNVAKYLRINANFGLAGNRPIDLYSLELPNVETELIFVNPKVDFSLDQGVDDIDLVQLHRRQYVAGLASDDWEGKRREFDEEIELSPEELSILKTKLAGRFFDGLLPAIHSVNLQVDPFSGHQRLLVEISEINYAVVLATHYVGKHGLGRTRERIEKEATEDRLFSLSLLPITSDGYLMAVRRSGLVGVAKGIFAPAANGLLELRDRLGLYVDKNEFGLPDPLLATMREAKEEINLQLSKDNIQILGLGQFSYDQEVKSWLLVTTTRIEMTAQKMVNLSPFADFKEGAWEQSGEFLAFEFPKTWFEAYEIARWAVNNKECTPHLRMSLLLVCFPILGNGPVNGLEEEELDRESELKVRRQRIKELVTSLSNLGDPQLPQRHKFFSPRSGE